MTDAVNVRLLLSMWRVSGVLSRSLFSLLPSPEYSLVYLLDACRMLLIFQGFCLDSGLLFFFSLLSVFLFFTMGCWSSSLFLMPLFGSCLTFLSLDLVD